MDENMNYDQVNSDAQPSNQEQPSQEYFDSVPVEPIPSVVESQPIAETQSDSKALAIAGMVCGIVSVVLVCCLTPVAILCAIAGIVLSIIALRKKQSKGMAIAGIITSAVGILLSIIMIIMTVAVSFSVVDKIENGNYNEYYYNDLYDEIYDDVYDEYYDGMDEFF